MENSNSNFSFCARKGTPAVKYSKNGVGLVITVKDDCLEKIDR